MSCAFCQKELPPMHWPEGKGRLCVDCTEMARPPVDQRRMEDIRRRIEELRKETD